MSEFRELDRLSTEEQKGRTRRRVRLGILAVLLALMGVDYVIAWPQSVRNQRALERALDGLSLPTDTVQGGVQSGRKPRSGFVSRLLLSSHDPKDMCEFFSNELVAAGWAAVENDCAETATKAGGSPDVHTASGYGLLTFAREGNTCSLRYYGNANDRKKYAIAGTWGVKQGGS